MGTRHALGVICAFASCMTIIAVLHGQPTWLKYGAGFTGALLTVALVDRFVLRPWFDRHPPRPHDARGQATLLRLGHHGLKAVIVAVLLGTSLDLTATVTGWKISDVAWWPVSVLMMGAWFLLMRHDGRLCERCISEVAVDRPDLAQGWRLSMLRLSHLRGLVVLVMLAVIFGGDVVPGHTSVHFSGAQGLLLDACMLAVWGSDFQHRRLIPWCPWCRGGGGGDDDDVLMPEPTPPGVKI